MMFQSYALFPHLSVITTLTRAVPAIQHNLVRYGLASRSAKVRAAEIPVLALENSRSNTCRKINAEILAAAKEDNCEAIVLGCAGMVDLVRELSSKHGLPIIDGVAAAVGLIQMLHQMEVKNSKRGGYAVPSQKKYAGIFAPYAPH